MGSPRPGDGHKRLQNCLCIDADGHLFCCALGNGRRGRAMSDPAITRLLDAVEAAMDAAEEAGLSREAAGAHVLAYAVRAMRDRLGGRQVAQALASEANRLIDGSLTKH